VEATAKRRRAAAGCLLEHLLTCLPAGARGNDQLAETTLGKLLAALESDLVLKAEKAITPKLLDRALLWLHEQEIIRLNKGLAVFRPAMTIRLEPDWKKKFTQPDFAPLKLHYEEQVVQIHVMAEYVQRGLKEMAEALHADDGLLQFATRRIHAALATRPRQGTDAPNDAGIVA
jgi:ATP-dependent DNA helicase RecQ